MYVMFAVCNTHIVGVLEHLRGQVLVSSNERGGARLVAHVKVGSSVRGSATKGRH